MKRVESLINFTKYLRNFHIPTAQSIFVVTEKSATSKLKEVTDNIILKVLPEIEQNGGTDNFTSTISTLLYVLGKFDYTNNTYEQEEDLYLELLTLTSEITTKLEQDISSGADPLLLGLTLKGVLCTPEGSLFGGWIGWSIEVVFE